MIVSSQKGMVSHGATAPYWLWPFSGGQYPINLKLWLETTIQGDGFVYFLSDSYILVK